jgi:hypothetical protein
MKQTLRNLIADGKTKQAIDQLRQLHLADTDLAAEVVQLAARFSTHEKQRLGNLEAPSVLGIELNKINNALLSVIDRLDDDNSKADLLLNYTKAAHAAANPSTDVATADTKQPFSWTKWTGLNDVKSWIAAFAGIASILGFYFKTCKADPKYINVSVYVEDQKSDLVSPLKKEGYVLMTTEGGGRPKELIDDKSRASFQNIKVGDKVRLNVDFSEPYRPINPDSIYTVPANGQITLIVGLQNLNRVFGTVIWRDQPLSGVLVAIGDLRTTTDTTGGYTLPIPEAAQRKEQEVKFLKSGYKMLIKKAFPQTNEPLNVVMEK